jgi:hypothetical protein
MTMNSMLLLTALSVGQPAPGAQPPMTLPTIQPMPPPAGMMPPMGTAPATNGNGNGNGEEEKKEEEPPPPEPYALMRLLSTTRFGQRLEERGVTISGWVQGNYTLSTNRRSNLPITFNDRADFWQMNQAFLRIDKPVDTSKSERQFGYRLEGIFGTDPRFTISRGLFSDDLKAPNPDGSLSNYYLFDMIQMYGDVFLPNLGPKGSTVRVGKFATHCGYELMQGAETPFLSRSYLFQYNPFTHTGVNVITQLNDNWTVSNGLVLGSDNFVGTTARPTYIGQLKWAPKEGKTQVLFNTVITDPRFDDEDAFPYYNVYDLDIIHNFNDKLTGVIEGTFSHIDGAPLPGGFTGSATWYGAAGYLIYKHCDKVTSNFRVELFEDTKGFRTGFKGLYTEVTYGLALEPVRGLIFRPTVRYDYNNNSLPFEGKANLFTAAFDMILRY